MDANSPDSATDGATAHQGRKGITIVRPRSAKKTSKASDMLASFLPTGDQMLGTRRRGPMIGTSTAVDDDPTTDDSGKPKKSPLTKKQLESFREILISKRAALIGDVNTLESEALSQSGGGLSNMPQHLADQGSDSYDQTLSLDLAAADRRLLKEVDDALTRMSEGTYGLCELTGQAITLERLEELPWTRHSIEAARMLESRHNFR